MSTLLEPIYTAIRGANWNCFDLGETSLAMLQRT